MTIHELIKEADKNKDNEIIRKSYINQVISAIKMQDKIYVMFNASTGYPHIDARENIWMFSTKEFAGHAQTYYGERNLKLQIMEIEHKDLNHFLFHLHLWGMERIVVDSGHEAFVILNRDALLPVSELTDEQKQHLEVVNPELQRSLLSFFGAVNNGKDYEKKQEYLLLLEEEMFKKLVKARFVVPVKHDTTIYDKYVREEDHTEWLPVFTDFSEMSKIYDPEKWDYQFLNYDSILMVAKNRGIVLNRKGMALFLGQESKDAIAELRKDKSWQ